MCEGRRRAGDQRTTNGGPELRPVSDRATHYDRQVSRWLKAIQAEVALGDLRSKTKTPWG